MQKKKKYLLLFSFLIFLFSLKLIQSTGSYPNSSKLTGQVQRCFPSIVHDAWVGLMLQQHLRLGTEYRQTNMRTKTQGIYNYECVLSHTDKPNTVMTQLYYIYHIIYQFGNYRYVHSYMYAHTRAFHVLS